MDVLLACTLAVVPCGFWLWSVWRHDDHEREPWGLVVLAMCCGGVVTVGVLATRPGLQGCFETEAPWCEAFVVTAAAEELWKLVALLPLYWHRELDEPLDGAVYGAAVGLGFAGVENVWFVLPEADAALALQRAFTSTLLHAACTGCLGLAWAEGKLRRFGAGTVAWCAAGLAIAIGGHGLYDLWLAGDDRESLLALLGVLPALLCLFAVKIRWAHRRSPSFHPSQPPPPDAGAGC